MEIEFDAAKEKKNIAAHGVDFSTVEAVFTDSKRITLPDAKHSTATEKRFYAIGFDGKGVLTVRYTIRGNAIRVIGVGYWNKNKKLYEKQK